MYKRWAITSFKSYSRSYLDSLEAMIDLSNGENCLVYLGCNTLTYTYQTAGQRQIRFSEEGSTAKICREMKIEEEFKEMFLNVSERQLADTNLYFILPNGFVISCRRQ